MRINNEPKTQSFQAIKYLSTSTYVPSVRFLKNHEVIDVDWGLRKVIENAPLLKKLGEKTDVYVCHHKEKDSNLHTLTVDFLEEKPYSIGDLSHENITLSHNSPSDNSFYDRIAKVFSVLVDDFDKFKSDRYIDTIWLSNPGQLLMFTHHGSVELKD